MSEKFTFEDFLNDVELENKAASQKMHDSMMAGGYKATIEKKASGLLISYKHPKTKRAILNLFFRKGGLQVRIYGENHKGYADFIDKLPETMEAQINKATQCKRFDPIPGCSPKCLGYDITIRGNRYTKCRYSCFHFEVNEKNFPVIYELIELEKKERGQ